ncbi:Pre-mRNA-splicing factor SPF27 [Gilbertella persicaria]|uniref:Pre-mRNA-splicing factor SPF27 n=1 Tax=Gilbertella persicaria TaxID=101096 RepID=UPI00221F7FC5|nr:Pre-mRNA-splicing factor SPF27 [Gilbertella persicaria]KAI8073498.1 Pre-mRNA-splicing factor SPF27 [Gilbertella persicaria]
MHAIEGPNGPDMMIDALPYVDRELADENTKAEVERLIEQEMRRMKRTERSSLPLTIDLFQHDSLLKQELERVERKQPLDVLDTKRYELQGPEDEQDIEGWKAAVNNTKSQLESQAGSMFNLELLQTYGANAWRVHNYQLEADLALIKSNTEQLRNQILEINRERKNDQTQVAAALKSLENKWSDLISQNLQVEIACAALESEVEELRKYNKH